MSGVALMRFLTRRRIGFRVGGIDRQTPRSTPRCTRWWRIWPDAQIGPFAIRNARVVVDFQHTVFHGSPYWQARARLGRWGFEWQNGPWS